MVRAGAGEVRTVGAVNDTPLPDEPADTPTPDGADRAQQLLAGLNPSQARAVLALDGPVMVVAGPGSGKTRVLTHRIAMLMERGVAPWNVLAVTFTNKAAAEMRERLGALVGPAAERMWVATFHSACVRLLRLHHQAAGLPRSFTILDSADTRRVLTTVAADLGLTAQLSATESKELISHAAQTISRAKNDGVGLNQLTSRPGMVEVAQLWQGYMQRCSAMGLLDFDDLLLVTLRLLESDADVLDWCHNRFSHILVDEYQDTNPVQERLVRLLAASSRNVCVVGDPDQSIYAFRGATPGVMEAFPERFPGAEVVVLERNYRSTANICTASGAVIAGNPAAHRAPMSTDAPAGDPVLLYWAADSDGEAGWVVDKVMAAHRDGRRWAQCAILVRTNALTRPFERLLAERAVPFALVGAQKFHERAEVKDAMAWLRLVVNPLDDVAFSRAVACPRRGVGPAMLEDLRTSGADSLLQAARDRAVSGGKGSSALKDFVMLVDEVADLARSQGPRAALGHVVDPVGVRQFVARSEEKDGVDRSGNLDQLLEDAFRFVSSPSSVDALGRRVSDLDAWESCVAFVESASLVADMDDAAGVDIDRVTVMTIHAAKGKEFDEVFVVGMEEGIVPHQRAVDAGGSELAEERRLLFVAMSRARHRLHLSGCAMRILYGQSRASDPSRFLDDVPEGILERIFQSLAPQAVRPGNWQRSAGRGSAGRPSWPRPAAPRERGSASGVGAAPVPLWGTPARSAPAAPRLAGQYAREGQGVTHPVFGDGVIVEVTSSTLLVDFSESGRKVLDRVKAPLSPRD